MTFRIWPKFLNFSGGYSHMEKKSNTIVNFAHIWQIITHSYLIKLAALIKGQKQKKNIEAGSRCFYFFCQCNAWLFPKGLSSPTFPRNDKDSLFWDCTGDALGACLREIRYLLKKTTFAIIYYSQLSLWSQQLFIARRRCGASYNRWSWTDVGEGRRGAADWSRVAFLSRSHFCSLWLQLRSYCCCCCN